MSITYATKIIHTSMHIFVNPLYRTQCINNEKHHKSGDTHFVSLWRRVCCSCRRPRLFFISCFIFFIVIICSVVSGSVRLSSIIHIFFSSRIKPIKINASKSTAWNGSLYSVSKCVAALGENCDRTIFIFWNLLNTVSVEKAIPHRMCIACTRRALKIQNMIFIGESI